MKTTDNSDRSAIIVWDLPTRVFHWLLVVGFALALITSDDSRYLYAHVYGGYLFAGLLAFRFIWGAVGSRYAKFRSFAYDWPSVTAYLKGLINGQASRYIGHNPAGSWAIFAMLLLGLLVVITGLVVLGGEERHGPLNGLISFKVGKGTKEIHELLAWSMFGLVVLHLCGVILESVFHKENLIWAMITGRKEAAAGTPGAAGHHLLGVTLLFVGAASALSYFHGYLVETADSPYRPFRGPQLPDNAVWREACGECHLAYHPNLLPARSWQLMMDEQAEHFGDDLGLDEETVKEVTDFLVKNAAEAGMTEAAWEMMESIGPDEKPLSIVETKYWKHEHKEISDAYWKSEKVRAKGNCAACHLDAKEGTFEDSSMRLPDLSKSERKP